MSRTRRWVQWGLLGALVLTTSCEDLIYPFDPCPDTTAWTLYGNVEVVEDVGQMDWVWELQSVQGQPLPFANPANVSESAISLQLHFDTDVTERGSDCKDVRASRGTTVAIARIREGTVVTTKRFSGTFKRDHIKNTTSLYYGQYELPLQRVGGQFTTTAGQVVGPVNKENIVFLLTSGLVLRFDRTSGPGNRVTPTTRIPR